MLMLALMVSRLATTAADDGKAVGWGKMLDSMFGYGRWLLGFVQMSGLGSTCATRRALDPVIWSRRPNEVQHGRSVQGDVRDVCRTAAGGPSREGIGAVCGAVGSQRPWQSIKAAAQPAGQLCRTRAAFVVA
ncbi:hypothetical protein B0T18DRAFT_3491 [Schizothecium vesticola]|uniref:Secreted protein n=1 Tax=Schizothecium vesticola TaxID=314040 RepID=A0AA40F7Z7_9PEZI|nr:hypothetical protein B0T18DRAFT_3491 [Schizothecium vesticola]